MKYLLFTAVFWHFTSAVMAQKPMYVKDLGDLFDSVQTNRIFSDQKKFVDCKPRFSPRVILEKYHQQRENNAFNLNDFIAENFDTTFVDTTDVLKRIDLLWDFLSRDPDVVHGNSTLIPLKHPYIVPGGRFREIYYWDTYFTLLGLAEAGKYEMIRDMLDNISDLIMTYGHMPNGNRTYYLSRSQPPFFSLMVELYARCNGDDSVYEIYYDALRKEYDFWNKGKGSLNEEFTGTKRVVMLQDHQYLNRYWDNLSTPRPESYVHDVRTKEVSGRDSSVYRELRAAAESGWDFSSRWFADNRNLSTIHTTDLVPVDLNCLLYHLELMLSKGCPQDSVSIFREAAETRKKLILKYCWNAETGFFFDYDFRKQSFSTTYSLAGIYPLFFKMVDPVKAKKVIRVIENKFLQDGGLVTTFNETGQQWDGPNGWPPLQWIGYRSCKNYGMNELAGEIASRWLNLNVRVFLETRMMMEKYDVVDTNRPGGGGEYKTQDGFGWTNGVFLKMWDEVHER